MEVIDDADNCEGLAPEIDLFSDGFSGVGKAQLLNGHSVKDNRLRVGAEVFGKVPSSQQLKAIRIDVVVVYVDDAVLPALAFIGFFYPNTARS